MTFKTASTEPGKPLPRLLKAAAGSHDDVPSTIVPPAVKSDGTEDLPPTQPAAPLPTDPTRTAQSVAASTAQPTVAPALFHAPERYQILNEHGRGGLGRVSRAHDRELGRDVAIKELISRTSIGEVRFLREAMITARLEHPGIVPMYEAGRWPDGTPYYAMKLVSGRPLRELIAERTTVDQRIGLLHHVIAVADAIAYAHGRNIIHRDLKPSNVIVGDFGETIVIDWGLAKDLSSSDEPTVAGSPSSSRSGNDLTAAGAVLGTPSYMAPEQERGEHVDQRADVFAIGAMLWELCALQKVPPTTHRHRNRLLRRAGIDQDLGVIIDKALDPDPNRRYPDAGALASDLKAFKSGARIAARSYSLFAMLTHWTRRHRALAFSVTIAIIVAIAGSVIYIQTVTIERDRADAALQRVEAANNNLALERAHAIEQRNELILAQATAALDSDPTRTLQWLKTYPLDGSDWNRAQIIAADAQSRGIARHVVPTMSNAIYISPDGKSFLTAGPLNLVHLWDLATGNNIRSLSLSATVITGKFAPDGKTIAIGARSGEVILWTPASDTRMLIGKLDGGAFYVAFSPDGRSLAASSLKTVVVWDLATLRQRWSWSSSHTITTLAIAPTGETLAFGTSNGDLNLQDFAHARGRRFTGHVGGINSIVFSVDTKRIITGGRDHSVRLWEPATGTSKVLGWHNGLVRDVRFSPIDPALVASGGADQKVRLWRTDGKSSRVFSGHTDMVNAVVFSPDGRTLASVSPDRQVRLWDVASGDSRVLEGHRGDLGCVVFSPDGSTLISSGYDEGTRVWDLTPPPGRILGRHEFEAVHAVFSPTSAFVASGGSDKTARLWNLSSGAEQLLPGSEYTGMSVAIGVVFSAKGDLLAAAGDNSARLWNLNTGTVRTFVARNALLRKVAMATDGGLIAAAGSDGNIYLWSVSSNHLTVLTGHSGEVTSLAFLRGGDRLASGGTDGTVRLWDISSASNQAITTHGTAITRLVISPAGDLIASGSQDGMIHLGDPVTHGDRSLVGHSDTITGLSFSRDGQLLASSGGDKTARVWNIVTGDSVVFHGHTEDVRTVAISPDGKTLATGANDQTVFLWNLENGATTILRGHHAAVRSVAFESDGKWLVSASEDATVRLWDLRRVSWVPGDRSGIVPWLLAQTSAASMPTNNHQSPTTNR